ncbi:MAG: flavin reductase family protein [Clostridia bacterium]|nr:flavin reductase family protein [Clostridia bacterium]
MKKDLGVVSAVFPMPVLMIGTYDKNKNVNVMNAAWGQICDDDKIMIFIGEGKKTWNNIVKSKAFTVSLADAKHITEADYFGIVSGNKINDKFTHTGLTAIPSEHVNAPIIDEFPVCMECELIEIVKLKYTNGIVGKIVNVKADENVLDEKDIIDPKKLNVALFDTFKLGYYTIGEEIAKAFDVGTKLLKDK